MIIVFNDGSFDEVEKEIAEDLIKNGKARIPNESDAEAHLAWLDSGW